MSSKSSSAVATVGIDIGKNSFHAIGLDERGAIVLRQKWSRGQLEGRLANTPPCLIGMEACVGAHHLSRKLQGYGHNARLMPAKYVRPYSKGQKNDFRDAEAIAEAVQRPTMKFVATKTADQLDLQASHRVRERLVSQRTGIINQIRAFLLERGVAVRQGLPFLRLELPGILAKRSDVLSPRMVRVIGDLAGDWHRLDRRIEDVTSDIEALAAQDPACERLMTCLGLDRSSQAQWLLRSEPTTRSRRGATSVPSLAWCPSRCQPETARSSARSRGRATVTCASCLCRRPG
jgi:transposase